MGLQDFSADSQWRLHVWIICGQLLLKLLVFLLGIPVPFVDLLELESSVFGKLLELQLCWLSLGVLVAFLQLLDLITGFSVPFKTHESGSVLGALLWGFLDLFWGFLGYSEGILLGDTHDSPWHETFHDAHVGAGSDVGFLHLKAELGVLDQSSSLVEDLFKGLNLGLF